MAHKIITTGTRAQVFHGTALHTSGYLKKSDLIQNKHGRIVSRRMQATARSGKRLLRAGYGTRKGVFGYVMTNGSTGKKRAKSRRRTRKQRR